MIFLGTILGADDFSAPVTPTDLRNLKNVRLQNGIFDDIYITKDTEILMSTTKPTEWTWDTILYADFDGHTMAGNIYELIGSISHLLIKRRRKDEFKWITINVKEIDHSPTLSYEELIAQMDLHGVDNTAAIGYEYEYAAVPVLNGAESYYSTSSVKCETGNIIFVDDTEIWATPLDGEGFTTTAVVPNSPIETMYDLYPTIVRNTDANYETISITATFIPGAEDCSTDWYDEHSMMEYNRAAYNFLRNGRPKIVKATDGRIWLVYVTTPPTDTYDQSTGTRKLTFQCTEIGSATDEEDLFYANLIYAGEEWWN